MQNSVSELKNERSLYSLEIQTYKEELGKLLHDYNVIRAQLESTQKNRSCDRCRALENQVVQEKKSHAATFEKLQQKTQQIFEQQNKWMAREQELMTLHQKANEGLADRIADKVMQKTTKVERASQLRHFLKKTRRIKISSKC